MSACVVCNKSEGKFSCQCFCGNATIHKQCVTSLAIKQYERKTTHCPKCGSIFGCLLPRHYTMATREKLKKRLRYTGICFGKTGIVPRYYGNQMTEETKKQLQLTWENEIDKELEESPYFAEKVLKNAKKRKVSFLQSGCKWD